MPTEPTAQNATPTPTPAPVPEGGQTPPQPSPAPDKAAGGLLGAEPPKDASTPDGEPKPTEAKPTEAKPTEGEAPPTDIELKLPEGGRFDEKLVGDFKATAKELGLKSEQAQKLFDLYAGSQAAQIAAVEKQVADWETAARSDKEYGGANFDANLAVARMAIQRLGTPELRQALLESGMGNHPELLRFAYRAGKAIAEDTIGGEGAPAKPNDAEARLRTMYPSMYPTKE